MMDVLPSLGQDMMQERSAQSKQVAGAFANQAWRIETYANRSPKSKTHWSPG